jgi:maltose O-acetyltransferase
MYKLLQFVNRIPNQIRRRNSYKKFHKYAICGKNLDVDARSDCYADHAGNIRIGNDCRIFGRLLAQDDAIISIGDHTCIYDRTFVGGVNDISIGSCVIISNHVHIFDNNNHPTSPAERRQMCMNGFDGDSWRWSHSASKPVVIEDNVWIGEYAAILKGVTVGKGSIVAAHAVVTKDVPPYSIVAGNPAVVVKGLEHEE